MPAKETTLAEAERAKRIAEAARRAEASEDPADFDRAFNKVTRRKPILPRGNDSQKVK
jgi:hypothetical protein